MPGGTHEVVGWPTPCSTPSMYALRSYAVPNAWRTIALSQGFSFSLNSSANVVSSFLRTSCLFNGDPDAMTSLRLAGGTLDVSRSPVIYAAYAVVSSGKIL